MDQICQSKCSEHFSMVCELKNPLFECLIEGKDYLLPSILEAKKMRK
jgi:hypothetical protein